MHMRFFCGVGGQLVSPLSCSHHLRFSRLPTYLLASPAQGDAHTNTHTHTHGFFWEEQGGSILNARFPVAGSVDTPAMAAGCFHTHTNTHTRYQSGTHTHTHTHARTHTHTHGFVFVEQEGSILNARFPVAGSVDTPAMAAAEYFTSAISDMRQKLKTYMTPKVHPLPLQHTLEMRGSISVSYLLSHLTVCKGVALSG